MSDRYNEDVSTTRDFRDFGIRVVRRCVRRYNLTFRKRDIALSANGHNEVLRKVGI